MYVCMYVCMYTDLRDVSVDSCEWKDCEDGRQTPNDEKHVVDLKFKIFAFSVSHKPNLETNLTMKCI
jgi:hypothetical protein